MRSYSFHILVTQKQRVWATASRIFNTTLSRVVLPTPACSTDTCCKSVTVRFHREIATFWNTNTDLKPLSSNDEIVTPSRRFACGLCRSISPLADHTLSRGQCDPTRPNFSPGPRSSSWPAAKQPWAQRLPGTHCPCLLPEIKECPRGLQVVHLGCFPGAAAVCVRLSPPFSHTKSLAKDKLKGGAATTVALVGQEKNELEQR